ncbi:MAG: stress response translation initiation inhibitor YciH [Thermoleophilia bacterium]|nr:stress response translation initiation inhibitor YciH [Thermoleophilia bacterium]
MNHRLVYSTDHGDERRREGASAALETEARPSPDGIVRVSREKTGRRGKTVTVVRGLGGNLASIAADLRKRCGTGGTAKDGVIEIQGDHADRVVARLQEQGHQVKRSGG